MTVNDIINDLKMEINEYEKKFLLNHQIEETTAVDGIEDLIKNLKTAPEVGC